MPSVNLLEMSPEDEDDGHCTQPSADVYRNFGVPLGAANRDGRSDFYHSCSTLNRRADQHSSDSNYGPCYVVAFAICSYACHPPMPKINEWNDHVRASELDAVAQSA